jgi:hypothetical protein
VTNSFTEDYLLRGGSLIEAQLMNSNLSRNTPPFMGPQGSLPCLQELATSPYPEPDESILHLPTLFA